MRRAAQAAADGAWPARDARHTATLAYDDRHRRRVRLATDDGIEFLLDLAEAIVLREGDGLRLDDGTWIAVHAAAEDVFEVRARDAAELARVAWHLGNRHLPVEIVPGALRIRADHVIADMLRGLGAEVAALRAPFTPEGGAYAGAADHGHRHDHAHDRHTHRHD